MKKIHDKRKKINIIPSQGLNLFSMSILSGQVMLFAVKQDQDKDRSSNSGSSWGLNHCFSIITQCIQAVNQHWYGLGTLLTLVYWSSSWSDMLTNIDLFQFLTLLRLLEQQPWKKYIVDVDEDFMYCSAVSCGIFSLSHTYPHMHARTHTPLPLCTLTVHVWGALLDHSLLTHVCQTKQWIDCSKLMTI